MKDEVAFYENVRDRLISKIDEKGWSSILLNEAKCSEHDGRGQLEVRLRSEKKNDVVAVLNFCGSAPFVHLGDGNVVGLMIEGHDQATSGGQQFTVDQVCELVCAEIQRQLEAITVPH